jgi:antitoxin component YwqK of YwqJK toxin-antitoxin module/peroxiredoxin
MQVPRAVLAIVSVTLLLAACGGPRVVNETWEGGQPKRQGEVVDGKQEGQWAYWYDSGKPQARGGWKGDKQFGEWTWWWPDGQMQSHGQYAEGGFQTGAWRQYHQTGKLASEGDYDRNRQDGMWRFWYPDGRPYAEGGFDFGVKSGPWRTWNADGSIKSQGVYFLGLKVGPWRQGAGGETTELGAPRGFTASKLTADGKPVAWAMSRTGADAAATEHLLDFPLRGVDGACLVTLADGAMRYAANLGGRGQAAAWYADGGIACAGRVVDGVKDGRWRYWHGNGQLASQLVYDHGRVAEQASWSPDGTAGGDSAADLVAKVDRQFADAVAQPGEGEGPLAAAASRRQALPAGDADLVAGQRAGDKNAAADAAAVPPAPPNLPEQSGKPASPGAVTEKPQSAKSDSFSPFGDEPPSRQAASPPPVVQPVPVVAAPVAAAPTQIDLAAPDPTAPSLSPIQVLPSFWTKGEESRAANWVQRYSTASASEPVDADYTIDTTVKSQRPDLLDKPLAQTRFLGADGSVVDVSSYKKPVVVVLLRGFGGQVCLYCAAQTAALCKRIDDFHKSGAEVVVLYPGPAESAPAFIQAVKSLSKEPPPMPVALDVSLLLVRALGVEDNLARPTSLVLDRRGKVRFAYVGKTIADRPSADDLLREVRRIVE